MSDRFAARSLRTEEWPVLRKLRLNALSADPEAFESTSEQETNLNEDDWLLRLPRRAVAFDGNEPIGLVGWSPIDEDAVPPTVELISMWVHPDVRSTGAADILVGYVKDLMRERGVLVRLAVRADNQRARRFYEKSGFSPTGEVETGRQSAAPLLWMHCTP